MSAEYRPGALHEVTAIMLLESQSNNCRDEKNTIRHVNMTIIEQKNYCNKTKKRPLRDKSDKNKTENFQKLQQKDKMTNPNYTDKKQKETRMTINTK